MNHTLQIRPRGLSALVAAAVGLPALSALAQTTPAPAAPASAAAEQPIVLNVFEVSAANVGPYQAQEAVGGGRIAQSLFDSSDNISVVTREFIEDTAPRDTFNAVKYLAGIANNSSQVAGDRVSIRGFQVSSPNLDGFGTVQSVVKNDPALLETVEFVRGPDSLLAPSGSPGGTLNLVSKSAKFGDFGSVTMQLGRYDTNAANFDINRTATAKFAYRLVGSVIDDEQGKNQGFHRSVGVSPSALIKLGDNTQLLLQATFFWGRGYNYLGFPIDPTSRNGTDNIRFLPGLDKYSKSYADNYGDESSANHSNRMIYRAALTTRINDQLSMRLSTRYLWDWQTNNQWNLTGNTGGSYNPNTGYWNQGILWSGTAATGFTSAPAPATSTTYAVSQSPTNAHEHYFDLQNDWVYQLKGPGFDSTTTGGIAAEAFHVRIKGYSATSPAVNVLAIPDSATWTPGTTPVSNQNVTGNFAQVYLSEKLKLLDGKLSLNGSLVPTWFSQEVNNYISGATSSSSPHPTFVNYGAVYTPIKNVALYYGHSADAAQISPPSAPTAINPNPPQLQAGKQDEGGLRLRFFDGRATASLSYFELHQTNNSIVNPALFSVPPPTVTPPNIFADRIARGWEFEFNASLTQNLSLLGNYTACRNRSVYGVEFRANPEHSGAIYVNYRFTEGPLNRLSLGLGVVGQSKAAGDSASGVTAASTPSKLIPNQPSFYIPGYQLVNLNASYKVDKHWTVRAYVDNVLNKSYIAGSLNANAVMPGVPVNPHVSATYSF